MGPRAGLNAVKRKKSHYFLCRDLKPGRPTRCLVVVLTELPRFHFASTEMYKFFEKRPHGRRCSYCISTNTVIMFSLLYNFRQQIMRLAVKFCLK
jgi:hypothetical protein